MATERPLVAAWHLNQHQKAIEQPHSSPSAILTFQQPDSRSVGLFPMQIGQRLVQRDPLPTHANGERVARNMEEGFEGTFIRTGGERSRCLIHAYRRHNVTVMQFVLGQKPSRTYLTVTAPDLSLQHPPPPQSLGTAVH